MEIKRIEDYYDKILEKFPFVNVKDLDTILKFGFRSYFNINKRGLDVLLESPYFTMYTGFTKPTWWERFVYWRNHYKKKYRMLYERSDRQFEFAYYISMTNKEYEEFMSQFVSKGNRPVKYGYIKKFYGHKLLEEALLDRFHNYIIKVSYPADVGYIMYRENLRVNIDNVKVLYKRDGFTNSHLKRV